MIGAEGGSRTRTSFLTTAFKSVASAIPTPRHGVKDSLKAIRMSKLSCISVVGISISLQFLFWAPRTSDAGRNVSTIKSFLSHERGAVSERDGSSLNI